jgi:signal transduction histidine kinase
LGIYAFTCNPLTHEGRLIGALCVFIQDEGRSFTEEELTFLVSVSDQAAQAIVNARLYQTLKEEQLSRTALLEKTISAQEDERKRIARELHDQTSQDLAALMLILDTFALGLTSRSAGTDQHFLSAKALVSTILTNIHHLINDLRPSLLDDLGLASAILWYGEQRFKPMGIAFELKSNRTEARLPPPVEIALFRSAQEALTNIVRHAQATSVKVTLDVDDRTVFLTIEDNGVGFQISSIMPEQLDGRGLGLRGMQERVSMLGGELDIQSTPGHGTIIKAKVPLLMDGFAND